MSTVDGHLLISCPLPPQLTQSLILQPLLKWPVALQRQPVTELFTLSVPAFLLLPSCLLLSFPYRPRPHPFPLLLARSHPSSLTSERGFDEPFDLTKYWCVSYW